MTARFPNHISSCRYHVEVLGFQSATHDAMCKALLPAAHICASHVRLTHGRFVIESSGLAPTTARPPRPMCRWTLRGVDFQVKTRPRRRPETGWVCFGKSRKGARKPCRGITLCNGSTIMFDDPTRYHLVIPVAEEPEADGVVEDGGQVVMHSIIKYLGRHIELPLSCSKPLDMRRDPPSLYSTRAVHCIVHCIPDLVPRFANSWDGHIISFTHSCAKDTVIHRIPPAQNQVLVLSVGHFLSALPYYKHINTLNHT